MAAYLSEAFFDPTGRPGNTSFVGASFEGLIFLLYSPRGYLQPDLRNQSLETPHPIRRGPTASLRARHGTDSRASHCTRLAAAAARNVMDGAP